MSRLAFLDFSVSAWGRGGRPSPLLPRADPRDQVLVFVVAVLTFLACLTAIAALGANRAAEGWQADLVGSASVLVRPGPGETADAAAARATEALAGVRGVTQAAMLDREDAEALLRPWLGAEILRDLPVPRLVALELDKARPATAAELTAALAAAGVFGTVDDHALWMKEIVGAGRMARLAALACALLLAATAAAVIAFATRAAITAWREAVEVLHLAGADDGFIAELFMVRFARLGAWAGALGAAAAILIAAAFRLLGGTEGLTPVLPVAWSDLAAPLIAPFIAAAIGAYAARQSALGMLRAMP